MLESLVERFQTRKHMCQGFEADHYAFQHGGVDGHARAIRYVDSSS